MSANRIDDFEAELAAAGGIARLIAQGSTERHALAAAVARGRLIRVRRGWYALPGTPTEVIAAARVGGTLTGPSALKPHGVWMLDDRMLHVAVPPGMTKLRLTPRVCVHRDAVLEPIADPRTALVHLIDCQGFEGAVAAVDSALHSGLVDLAGLISAVPGRRSRVVEWSDGRAESGTESMVRVRLRSRRIRFRVQVRIAGIGRVDLLVGDRLVIECDSRAWHTGAENYASDRRRDLLLLAAGYRVVRLTYEQVMFGWEEVEPILLELIRQRRHLGLVRP